jgi:Na+/proline symporter
MAAVTVSDFYVPFVRPNATEAEMMRLARQSTIGWGVVQIGVALAAQWMDRSVLDAGLAVLSLAAGPVLGAFLVGVLSRRVQTAPCSSDGGRGGRARGFVVDGRRRLDLVRVYRRRSRVVARPRAD